MVQLKCTRLDLELVRVDLFGVKINKINLKRKNTGFLEEQKEEEIHSRLLPVVLA